MLQNCLAVGLGGALGAIFRYLLGLIPIRGDFPFLTLATNLLGAVAIGCVVGAMACVPSFSPRWALFAKTGLCGGFTTFSTFSLETLTLFEQHKPMLGTGYAVLSVTLCLLGVWAGRALTLRLCPAA